jgi:hypothetical protein
MVWLSRSQQLANWDEGVEMWIRKLVSLRGWWTPHASKEPWTSSLSGHTSCDFRTPCYLNSNDIYSDGEPIIGRVIPPWILTPLQPLFRAKLHDMPVCIGEKSKARVWVIKDLQIFLLILIGRRHVLKVDQTANPPRPVKASSVPDSIVFR